MRGYSLVVVINQFAINDDLYIKKYNTRHKIRFIINNKRFIYRNICRLIYIKHNKSLNMATMNISENLADNTILTEIGARIAQRRLELQLTQAELAEQAGIAKRTVERIESGGSAQMASVVRILRVLDLLPGLDRMLPAAGPRPMDLLKQKGKPRQRASRRRHSKQASTTWSWNENP